MSTVVPPLTPGQITFSTSVQPKPLPWWVSFSINTGIAAVHQALRNPAYAATEREIMLELYQAIGAAYAGDPDFQR